MKPEEDEPVFRVLADQGGFLVVDAARLTVMVCRDAGSADQYATLLNQAYQKGFKAGYRKGRGARRPDE
jgi:hypothetical protein